MIPKENIIDHVERQRIHWSLLAGIEYCTELGLLLDLFTDGNFGRQEGEGLPIYVLGI